MSLIAACTRRRVTVAMATVLALVFGLISLSELKVNLLPDLSYPTLTVRTEFVGAAPAEIETLVSQPVEEQVGVVKGVKRVKSVSRSGQSDVLLEFEWGTDMDLAGLEVREKLELLQLPLQAKRPILLRFNPSTDPVLRLAFYDASGSETFDEATLKRLRRFADEEIKKRLEPVEGVAAVKISGGLEDEIQVQIHQDRLAQFGLGAEDVIARLREENVNVSGGRIEESTQRYLVRTVNQFASVDEIRALVVTITDGRPIYLRDVADVVSSYKERQAVIRTNGREAVEIAIYKEGDANTVRVVESVRTVLESMEEDLLQGLDLLTVDDQSAFIRQAISDVRSAAIYGGILAILIIFFFLRDAWATAIISASIPVSVIATFFFMDMAGLSLNIMSLGGIALAIGLLVDNAIVVLENIARRRQQGADVTQAAVQGAGEVGGAVFAATLTTIAVFLPLVFVEGIGGQLFSDQALTVTFALILSLAVALTVIPMLSSLRQPSSTAYVADTSPLAQDTRPGFFGVIVESAIAVAVWLGVAVARILGMLLRPAAALVSNAFSAVQAAYDSLLPRALERRSLVLVIAIASLVGAGLLVPRLGAELIPQMAQGQFEMQLTLPPGTPLARTDRAVASIQQGVTEIPQIVDQYAVSGSGNRIDANPTEAGENVGNALVVLRDSRPETEAAALRAMRDQVGRVPGATAEFSRPQLLSFETPLEVEVVGYDLAQLKRVSASIAERLRALDRLSDVRSSLEAGHPEIQIFFDQERAAQLGLTVRDISDQVVQKLRGEVATRYSFRDRKIDVLVRSAEGDRSSIEDVRNLIINPRSERPIVLASVAEIVATEGPAEINRVDQERAALVTANLQYGTLKEAVAATRAVLSDMQFPYGISARVAGQSDEMDASFESLLFALSLAIFLVYLVMASQFESLIHPFVILLSVPLALVGAVLALFITNTAVSVIVFIGLIMLAGIVVNNAIVLIDLINQLRRDGMDKRSAIIEGGRSRLRPIAMTTLTTTLGLLPLAIGLGDGAEVRTPMAITVIGGLLVSTLLTLVVIPVVYDILDPGTIRRIHAEPAAEPTP